MKHLEKKQNIKLNKPKLQKQQERNTCMSFFIDFFSI